MVTQRRRQPAKPTADNLETERLVDVESDDHPAVKRFIASIVALAAGGAFFAQPVLRFGHTALVTVFGLFLVVGAVGGWSALRNRWGHGWSVPYLAIGLLGAIGMTWQVTVGIAAIGKNDQRCAQLQKDMFSANPIRIDSKDLFQALDCVPQIDGDIEFKNPGSRGLNQPT